jgi:hypothetical protein
MFDYKETSFYTSFFQNHPDFRVIDEFKESEDMEERNCYVGRIEVLNTIHPLELRVEIPKSFPHKKLTFRTKSLFGYPHLIYKPWRDPKAKKYGGWFCLNTPFAETAENQLEQEVLRLKEWIARQMRPELEAIIKDDKVRKALAFESAYSWENADELSEYHGDAILTFVGDFSNDLEYFKEKMGTIHCVKTPDKRFFALQNKELTNFELPYIIVDEAPKSVDTYKDFVLLRNQYDWDEKTCEHLLSTFNLHKTWVIDPPYSSNMGEKNKFTLEESLSALDRVKEELSKDESYLPAHIDNGTRKENVSTKVIPQIKELIKEGLVEIEKKVKKDNGFTPSSFFSESIKDFDEMTPEEQEEDIRQEQAINVYLNEFHYFALGIKEPSKITWLIYYTTRNAGQYDSISFDLGISELRIKKLISYHLSLQFAQIVNNTMFFGRGLFSQKLRSKRIALVGLGALGSMLAESLVRSGVTVLGLWDDDIVEPGNICRSTYQLPDLGESKVKALKKKLLSINPFIKAKEIKDNGYWGQLFDVNFYTFFTYKGGSFYGNINYSNQEDSIKQIKDYDLIIDCTGSNELLHFISYAVPETDVVSLCITNHSSNLLCISSKDGNPFELRKAYLSRIEQDTKNFYLEGSGCYSPTFLATNSDIASLLNLFVRELNQRVEHDEVLHSTIWSHDKRGVLADRLKTYKLEGYDIRMTICSETIYDGEDMADSSEGSIGYLLGSYSRDGQLIMVTHIIDAYNAKALLEDAFRTSKGIIDYIGDYVYSTETAGTYSQKTFELIANKADDESINTCNPMLAVRNPDRSISFFLYINNELVPFIEEN